MQLHRIIYTLLLLLFSTFTFSQSSLLNWSWPVARPSSENMNTDSLEHLDKELASGRYGHVDGMLIIRHGKIVYEKSYKHDYASLYKKEAKTKGALNAGDFTGPYNYYNSWWHPFLHNTSMHSLQSVSKTITSIIIGVAITRNEFPDINTPILKYFDITKITNIDDRKRRITIRDLLTMTAGFDWNENLSYEDPRNTGSQMEATYDWVNYVINRPMSDEPGKVFNYNGRATQLLAYIFHEAVGMDIEQYAVNFLFGPLGIKNHFWKRSPSGLVDSEGGVYLEKSDLAKLFYLYLNKGQWEGKTIISKEWVAQSVTPYIKLGDRLAYGYKWWLTSYGDKKEGSVWMGNGFGGQYPIIIPEYDIIAVFNAWDIKEGQRYSLYNPDNLVKKVLHTVNEYNVRMKQ